MSSFATSKDMQGQFRIGSLQNRVSTLMPIRSPEASSIAMLLLTSNACVHPEAADRIELPISSAKASAVDRYRAPQIDGRNPLAFPGMADFKANLDSDDPKKVERALLDLAQATPYLARDDCDALLLQALTARARRSASLASAWAAGLFAIGGPHVRRALLRHAEGSEGSPLSRRQARQLLSELEVEAETRAALQNVPARGVIPASLRFEPVAAEVDAITVGPSFLHDFLSRPEHSVEQIRKAGFAPVIATDLDGTCWKGDIGEALFDRAIEEKLLAPEASKFFAKVLARFGLPPKDDPNEAAASLREAFESGELLRRGRAIGLSDAQSTRSYYEAIVCAFAGHSVATLKGWARQLFEERGFREKIFPGIVQFFEHGRREGFIPYAVSASNQWIVEVGAEYLGIPPWRVLGVKTVVENGIIQPRILAPVTYGPGKVDAIQELVGGRRPAIALGDSVEATDREMLLAAAVSLAVEPKEERVPYVLRRVAAHQNWRLLRFPIQGRDKRQNP